MSRFFVFSLTLLSILLFASFALAQSTVDIRPLASPQDETTTPTSLGINNLIQVSITTAAANNLFIYGHPLLLTAHITNPTDTQQVKINFSLRSGLGCLVYSEVSTDTITKNSTLDKSYTIGDHSNLPRGPYVAQVIVKSDTNWGYQETHASIWDGPASHQNNWFGISYLGSLNTKRSLSDLDLFKAAGVGWLRFQMQGWLPQGEATPPEADNYNSFIQTASDRGFKLLAAFTPQITVDSSVNAVQSAKDYHESLLAAAARYGFKVKSWELLKVPPPAFPRGLHGIDFGEIKQASGALQRFDKTLQVIFPVDGSALLDNVNTWHLNGQPTGNNALGIHSNINNLPENQLAQTSVYTSDAAFNSSQMNDIAKTQKKLKLKSTTWATEYGFDNKFAHSLQQVDTYQAAILSRMLIINKLSQYTHVFWRHNPANQDDVPFTADDNAAQPTLLALRTTLDQMNNMDSIVPIFSSITGQERGINMYLLRFNNIDKKDSHNKKSAVNYKLVAWSDRVSTRTSMAIMTGAPLLNITDIWGNTEDLLPTGNIAIFQIDEFPRFIDLGNNSHVQPMNAGGTAYFTTPYKIVSHGTDNSMAFHLENNQKIFSNHIAGKLIFNVWPDTYQDVVKIKDPFGYDIGPYNSNEISCANFDDALIPEDAQTMKELCEVSVDILSGDRRMGYLTLPVYYSPKIVNKDK